LVRSGVMRGWSRTRLRKSGSPAGAPLAELRQGLDLERGAAFLVRV
jgi:hypothetical protein